MKVEIEAGLKELAAIPPFNAKQIVALCRRLRERCDPYDQPYSRPLKEIEEAVFARNSKKVPQILATLGAVLES